MSFPSLEYLGKSRSLKHSLRCKARQCYDEGDVPYLFQYRESDSQWNTIELCNQAACTPCDVYM